MSVARPSSCCLNDHCDCECPPVQALQKVAEGEVAHEILKVCPNYVEMFFGDGSFDWIKKCCFLVAQSASSMQSVCQGQICPDKCMCCLH